MPLIFCVELGCTWDGHGWLWKHIWFAAAPWLLPFPIIWRAKNITSATFTATIQENEAKWHMSFLTLCFQIKITPRRQCQRCRLVLSKRQIKGQGFKKYNQIFLAHWYALKLPAQTTLRNFSDGGSIPKSSEKFQRNSVHYITSKEILSLKIIYKFFSIRDDHLIFV